jgi:hypothetical protein
MRQFLQRSAPRGQLLLAEYGVFSPMLMMTVTGVAIWLRQ